MKKRPLNQQQLARIRLSRDKKRQLDDTQTSETVQSAHTSGRVVASFGQHVHVITNDKSLVVCTRRQNLGPVVCFDEVLFENHGSQTGVVVQIKPRMSLLIRQSADGLKRPLCSNIDQLVIVIAPQPAPHATTIDRYLIAAAQNSIQPILICNKLDLLDATSPLAEQMAIYEQLGYKTLCVSQKTSVGLDALEQLLAHKISLLLGPSGVGKSSLTQGLLPEQDIRIGRLSEQTGRGTHTTTTARYYALSHGGGLIDAPGIRDFPLGAISQTELLESFPELAQAQHSCRFRSCQHQEHDDCGLRQALKEETIRAQRLDSYLSLSRELAALQQKW